MKGPKGDAGTQVADDRRQAQATGDETREEGKAQPERDLGVAYRCIASGAEAAMTGRG